MKPSAGLLMYKKATNELKFFLIHHGGPFFARKDEGVWSIPKGEIMEEEEPLGAAQREFYEETGKQPNEPYLHLGEITQKGGKVIHVWAFEGDLEPKELKSNLFTMEFPPKSGKYVQFPEVDRGGWFNSTEAEVKIISRQYIFIQRLTDILKTEKGIIERV